jgi:putative lipoprotein
MSSESVWSIRGEVHYLEEIELAPNSTLYVSLQDVSVPDVPGKLLFQEVVRDAERGLSFLLAYREEDVMPGHQYAISAHIKSDDKLIFKTIPHRPVTLDGTDLTNQKVLVRAYDGRPCGTRNPDRP